MATLSKQFTAWDIVQSQTSEKQLKLSNLLFVVFFCLILAIAAAAFVATTLINYNSYEKQAEADLTSEVDRLADLLNGGKNIESIADSDLTNVRCTLIDANGTVTFDTAVDPSALGSHVNRQEFKDAKGGSATAIVRYSETTGMDAIYAAKQLKNGNVVRLSEERLSLIAYLSPNASVLILLLVATLIVSFIASRLLTNKIIKPLKDVNLDNPETSYAEMQPLLNRINEQNNLRREFTSNVSHEMKTPLQVIGGYAELIQEGVVPKKEVPKTARLIRKEAEQMRELIDDVLTLSKLDENAMAGGEEIVLGSTIKHVINRLEKRASKKDIKVLTTIDKEMTIKGSAQLADQMVYNLIDNAIKYSEPGSTVKVALTKSRLIVADEGQGIPNDQRERIFERFYRVDESRSRETGGTGLGLAIVKHAVESFGATIHVEDNPEGKGSAFIVDFK